MASQTMQPEQRNHIQDQHTQSITVPPSSVTVQAAHGSDSFKTPTPQLAFVQAAIRNSKVTGSSGIPPQAAARPNGPLNWDLPMNSTAGSKQANAIRNRTLSPSGISQPLATRQRGTSLQLTPLRPGSIAASTSIQEAQRHWEGSKEFHEDEKSSQAVGNAESSNSDYEEDSGDEDASSSSEAEEPANVERQLRIESARLARAASRLDSPNHAGASSASQQNLSHHKQPIPPPSAHPTLRKRSFADFQSPSPLNQTSPTSPAQLASSASSGHSIEYQPKHSQSPPAAYTQRKHATPNELEAKIRRDFLRESMERQSVMRSPGIVKNTAIRPPLVPPHYYSTTLEAKPRLYASFPTPDGIIEYAQSAIAPTNWKHHTDQAFPYICPVRDCQALSANLRSLAGHFGASHNKTTFNDNLDGTISAVGKYSNDAGRTSPGIVVSQNAIASNAPPPARPAASNWVTRQASWQSGSSCPSVRPTIRNETPVPAPVPDTRSAATRSPAQYLSVLLHRKQPVHNRTDIQELTVLPFRRPLPQPWLNIHGGTVLDATHYACAIAYIVGAELPADRRCRAVDSSTSSLAATCIELPPELSSEAKAEFYKLKTCVGCRYWIHLRQNRDNQCTLRTPEALTLGSKSAPVPIEDEVMEVDVESIEPSPEDVPKTAEVAEVGEKPEISDTTKEAIPIPEKSTVGLDEIASKFAPSIVTSESLLHMEDWEFVPGRMTTDQSPITNIAFSNSYLRSREPVDISDGVRFNLIVLGAGSSNHWRAQNGRLRTCSVASGKITVKISGKEFLLGQHGMFVVHPGQQCTVENRLYVDAIIHCTTINDY